MGPNLNGNGPSVPIRLWGNDAMLLRNGELMIWKIPIMQPPSQAKTLRLKPLMIFPDLVDEIAENIDLRTKPAQISYFLDSNLLLIINWPVNFAAFRIQHRYDIEDPDDCISCVIPAAVAIYPDTDNDFGSVCNLSADPTNIQLCDGRPMFTKTHCYSERLPIFRFPMVSNGMFLGPLVQTTGRLCRLVDNGSHIYIADYL
ncbi:hypothetical protein CPB84DRAFT_373970 [Gymnopilus junonius]|uniref:Uncharacterized protein n=1 Tax=Gymnopilus junonius TaxID=109634 RepID=A0A9P5NCD3_GYMJU|nr:hypothetical protein CPB84DRAFT_373970 [Gymnopilus junonius]